MDPLAFIIPGEARGKGRARATNRGGKIRMFTDSRTASYENLVALAATEALQGREPFDAPVAVDITVRLSPPASTSQKKRLQMLAGELPLFGRFDLDNITKAVLDGLNRVAYTDDRLVMSINARRVASEAPSVRVCITPIDYQAAAIGRGLAA